MDKVTYPTGVENHGGTLRIWFNFKGKRVRESLGVPDTLRTERSPGNCGHRYVLPSEQAHLSTRHSFRTPLTSRLLGWGRKKLQCQSLPKSGWI